MLLGGYEGMDASAAAAAEVEEEQSDDEDDEDSFDGDGQPRKKRARRTRTELNEIEKQRTRRINEQIQSLRALLEASGLNTKKDKFSILKNTTEYLKKLKLLLNKSQAQIQALAQSRRAAAAAAAAGGGGGTSSSSSVPPTLAARPDSAPQGGEAETKYYVDVDPDATRGAYPGGGSVPPAGTALQMMIQRPPIAPGTVAESGAWTPNKKSADYSLMFQNASIAMAVASLDGKFVDCNGAFSIISGYSNDEVLKRSVFDLTPAEDCQELMSIVGKMMESPAESAKHFWKRCCFENRDCHCFVSMWLVRKASGEPVYFQCAVLPLEDYPMSNKSVTYDASATGLPSSAPGETPAIEGQAAVSEVNALLQEQPPHKEEEEEAGLKLQAGAAAEKAPLQAAAAPLTGNGNGNGHGVGEDAPVPAQE